MIDCTEYAPGGYHPININDRLKDGRYEILNKLGSGSFSTVWIARDHHTRRNVSLKVVVADKSDQQIGELKVLQHLKSHGDPDHPGHRHVAQLVDSFEHAGPNGQHLCIVMDLLGPKLSEVAERRTDYRLNGNTARHVSRQLLLAVDYMHSCGVVHGDIHMGNVLYRMPNEGHTVQAPQIGELSRKNGAPLQKGLPQSLVEPIEYDTKSIKNLKDVQLVDFGESFFISDPRKAIYTPLSMHPPELVFRRKLSQATDIWNLGCTTFELVTGRKPFEADFDDADLVPQFQKVIGGIPDKWIEDAIRDGILTHAPDDRSAEGFLPLGKQLRRSYFGNFKITDQMLKEDDLESLESYLQDMLVVDPMLRATSKKLVKKAWISNDGLKEDGNSSQQC